MKQLRLSVTFALLCIAFASFAQDAPAHRRRRLYHRHHPWAVWAKTLLSIKKEIAKRKLTIVIDGDNITINGKPAKDYKDGDVQVIRRHR